MNLKCYPVKLLPRIAFILKRNLVRQNIFYSWTSTWSWSCR